MERRADEQTVQQMCDLITHRGPDDQGIYVDANVGMGMRRLSIVDLEGGHQPIFNEDGSIGVVFNGEIYNHSDLQPELEGLHHVFRTRSDTEVLVHGYETWKSELPRHLNGMFAFSIWDRRERRLVLARDHIGVKPLYVYEDKEKLAWASEIKALLAVPGIRAELDERSLLDFLTFGYVPAPRTMLRGIRKLPPASILIVENNRSRLETYWDLTFHRERTRTSDQWCEEVRMLVDDAVRRQLMSDVPLGAFLSGGIDSSSIVATMHRLGVPRISTYSIGFGGEDAFHNELEKAAIVSRQFDTDHHEIVVEPNVAELLSPLIRHLDEPVTDTSFLVTYLVSRLARETVTVILSGVGGDEIFAGYRRYLWPRLQQFYDCVPGVVHRRVLRPLVNVLPVDRGSAWKSSLRYLRGFLNHVHESGPNRYQSYVGIFSNGTKQSVLSSELATLERQYASTQVADYYATAPSDDPLDRMMYADLKTSLVDSLLAFTDKMSMAVSLEARVPLLDYRLVELAARIPSDLKLRGLNGLKNIFKLAMSDRLPHEIIHRKKQGFGTPISRWFRTSLMPLLQDVLSRERIARRGYFDQDAVWRLIDDHVAERADNSEHILAFLTFEIWHQTYLDSRNI
jgi:asparagine synthase (glutamine-hydrolysing)